MNEDDKKLELKNPTIHQRNENCQVFNGPISGCVFAMPGSTVNQHATQTAAQNTQEQDDLPTKEEMCAAIKETVRQGLWWSNRSWAVAYRVYQIKGYANGFTQFVGEVKKWNIKTGYECNYDAVQKPVTSGKLNGKPEKWVAQGAQKQAAALADALLAELDNLKNKENWRNAQFPLCENC